MAAEGAPSLNSKVPNRLSTRSGVEIDASSSAETESLMVVSRLPALRHCEVSMCNLALGVPGNHLGLVPGNGPGKIIARPYGTLSGSSRCPRLVPR